MATAEQELLLKGLMDLLSPEQVVETPMNNDNGTTEPRADTPAPAPQRFVFSRGEYKPGDTVPLEMPAMPSEPESTEPSVVQRDTKKLVEKPEDSYVVSPDKLKDFGALMHEGDEKPKDALPNWEDMTGVQRAATVTAGVVMAALVFLVLLVGINWLSGGRQLAPQPTSAAQAPTANSMLGAGASVPSAAPAGAVAAPTSAPAATEAPAAPAATGTCDGIQYYHSPDVNDVGPCVPTDEAVVPTGVYGTDGVWLFMILADGSTKWVKAESYGYSPEQVKAMNLKDYAAVAAPAPKPPTSGGQPSGGGQPGGWTPAGGPPPPAATATPEPATATPVPPTETPGCAPDGNTCTKENTREPPPTKEKDSNFGTKGDTRTKSKPVDGTDPHVSRP